MYELMFRTNKMTGYLTVVSEELFSVNLLALLTEMVQGLSMGLKMLEMSQEWLKNIIAVKI